MITPRQTRLYNTPDVPTFQRTIAGCLDGPTRWNRRASVVLVPSRAAADQLRWTLERLALERDTAVLLPRLLTRDELYAELHSRVGDAAPVLSPIERLVCGRAAAADALASGVEPPFNLCPALVAEFLALYDELTRPGPSSRLLDCLLRFLDGHRAAAPADADTASRESRARTALVGVIRDIRDAHARHDDPIEELSTVTSMLRRWIEAMTFAAPTGTGGCCWLTFGRRGTGRSTTCSWSVWSMESGRSARARARTIPARF